MYITLDFRCTVCSIRLIDEFVKKSEVEHYRCPVCESSMVPLPSATRTTFVHADPGLKK